MIGSPQLALSSSANPTATVVTDMSIPTPERLRKQARRPYRRIRVIRHPQIVGVGDALPLGAAAKSQTFRYAEDPDQEDQTKCHQGGPK
jgi:hypothetical protein